MSITWNPWHGCHKISPGCANCYVYRADKRHGRDSTVIKKTAEFDLPLKKNRQGRYKIPWGELVYTCFTSDFLLEEADPWRGEVWQMMRTRSDLEFLFITKRIHRFKECLPPDWGEGYPNVHVCCTVENQDQANFRLPIFQSAPIAKKSIVCEPLLGYINLSDWLGNWVEEVLAGGESGSAARICKYDWVLDIRRQCIEAGVPFTFHQTGERLEKDGKLYCIRRKYQHSQAKKADINT